ncbi:MAG: DUF4259 domain-containing protein [Verrucomicrobiaceae bacterium]|nr:MAG: DUF4259 domain-containing protein [Verrucomicrobiaceae bacterium]
MGAWGAGSFENDDALDWIAALAESNDTSILEEAFSSVTDGEDYLDATDCTLGIALLRWLRHFVNDRLLNCRRRFLNLLPVSMFCLHLI